MLSTGFARRIIGAEEDDDDEEEEREEAPDSPSRKMASGDKTSTFSMESMGLKAENSSMRNEGAAFIVRCC